MTPNSNTEQTPKKDWKSDCGPGSSGHRKGNVLIGIFLLIIGVLALARSLDAGIPSWIFSWPMIIIGIGLFIGIRHNFRGLVWFFMMVVGTAFLAERIDPTLEFRQFIWPGVFIMVGGLFIYQAMKSKRRKDDSGTHEYTVDVVDRLTSKSSSQDDYIDSVCIFGGTKKNVLSKHFKGGEIVNIFGGAEINLGQADLEGNRVSLEITQIFGGTKIIVPSNWEVKPEIVALFGGIEDKRDVTTGGAEKVLILRGTSIFGGIDIKRY